MHEDDLNLGELMHRATDGLQTDSTGLVQRVMAEGSRMRRRRRAGRSIAAATAVLLAGAAVVTAQWIGPGRPGAQVGGSPPVPPPGQESRTETPPASATPDTAQSLLLTVLVRVLPRGIPMSGETYWGNQGFSGVGVIVDDGNGLSKVTASVERRDVFRRCPAPVQGRTCEVLSDGSVLLRFKHEATNGETPNAKFPSGRPDQGVNDNRVQLHRSDGTVITLTNYNAPAEKGAPDTRPLPPFSVARLASMARSPLWRYIPPATQPRADPAPLSGAPGRNGNAVARQ